MSTTASPGPGSGIVTVSIETGSPLPLATTPRTCCMRPPALGSCAPLGRGGALRPDARLVPPVRRTRRLTGEQEGDGGDVRDHLHGAHRGRQRPGAEGGEQQQREYGGQGRH